MNAKACFKWYIFRTFHLAIECAEATTTKKLIMIHSKCLLFGQFVVFQKYDRSVNIMKIVPSFENKTRENRVFFSRSFSSFFFVFLLLKFVTEDREQIFNGKKIDVSNIFSFFSTMAGPLIL